MSYVEVPNIPPPYHRLFYGSYEMSGDEDFIQENNIKYIVSLDSSGYNQRKRLVESGLITYTFHDLSDDGYFYYQSRKRASDIIHSAAENIKEYLMSGNTYVHCHAGINRAPTCVAAFLIIYLERSSSEVFEQLRFLNKTYRKCECLLNHSFCHILENEIYQTRLEKNRFYFW